MVSYWVRRPKALILTPFILLLLLIVACGAAATTVPEPPTAVPATTAAVAGETPVVGATRVPATPTLPFHHISGRWPARAHVYVETGIHPFAR